MTGVLDSRIGQVVFGDYRVIRPLGHGGMGAVFLVLQISTGRKRALKLLKLGAMESERVRQSFIAEARIAAQLDSDHIVDVVAAGFDPDTGAPYLVTEYLDGETLQSRVERTGPRPGAEVKEIMRQVCHGVGQAHAAGLVHRDLKPANLFVADPRRDGVPFTLKVLDFGIAKLAADDLESGGASAPIGSPLWMAPEQSQPHRALPSIDVWALGLCAYFCLTGRPFWNASPSAGLPQLLNEIVSAPIPLASERARAHGVLLPAGFDGWFARTVNRDPTLRFRDAREVLAALEGWQLEQHGALPAPHVVAPPARVTWSGEPVLAPGDTSISPPPSFPASEPGGTGHVTDGTFRPIAETQQATASKLAKPVWLATCATVVLGGGLATAAVALAVAHFSGALPEIGLPSGPAPSTTSAAPSSTGAASDTAAAPSTSADDSGEVAAPSPAPNAPRPRPTVSTSSAEKSPPAAPAASPATASTPSGPAPSAAPAAGPTAAQIGGFRALVVDCWKNNEGASATSGASLSITLRVDAMGIVRSTRVDGASAYPHTRSCIVTRGSSYGGFKQPPPTFSETSFSVGLSAAK